MMRHWTGAAFLASIAGCGTLQTHESTSENTSETSSEAAGRTDEPLPPGGVLSPDGSELTITPGVLPRESVTLEFLSSRFAVRGVSLARSGEVRGFTLARSTPGLAPGTYQVDSVRVGPNGQITSMTQHNASSTDCCWMTVVTTGTGDSFSCSGSCTDSGSACSVKYVIYGSTPELADTIFTCECKPVN